jgi:arginyl-tRNA synthetase
MLTLKLTDAIEKTLQELYGPLPDTININIEETNSDYEGDYTFVVFPYLKLSRKSPEATATEIAEKLITKSDDIESYNVLKGFLNLKITDKVWLEHFYKNCLNKTYGLTPVNESLPPVLIEYSSPNTNKPLHLGHIRNNLIGHSVARILEANGVTVKEVNLINDRGIHICKTMLAWIKWGQNHTPESLQIKGDKFVGEFYVKFEQELQKELLELAGQNMNDDEAMQYSKLMQEARELLVRWEQHDHEVRHLWMKMNDWVLKGFEDTYQRMNIRFDKLYFESETYLPGREIVLEGLSK